MKLSIDKNNLVLTPENSYDYFELGCLSKQLPHTILRIKGTDKPLEIQSMTVPFQGLLDFMRRMQ